MLRYANSVTLEVYHITDLAEIGRIDTPRRTIMDSSGYPREDAHSRQIYAKPFTGDTDTECY